MLLAGPVTVANTFGVPCHISSVHLWLQLLGQFLGGLSAQRLQVFLSAAGQSGRQLVPWATTSITADISVSSSLLFPLPHSYSWDHKQVLVPRGIQMKAQDLPSLALSFPTQKVWGPNQWLFSRECYLNEPDNLLKGLW